MSSDDKLFASIESVPDDISNHPGVRAFLGELGGEIIAINHVEEEAHVERPRVSWCPCHGGANAICTLRGDKPVTALVMCDCRRVLVMKDRVRHQLDCPIGTVKIERNKKVSKTEVTLSVEARYGKQRRSKNAPLPGQMPLLGGSGDKTG